MSKLGDFFTGLGYIVSKDHVHRNKRKVRVKVPEPSEDLLGHLIEMAKEAGFDVNTNLTTINYYTSHIHFWLNPIPVTPKTPEELIEEEREAAIKESLGEVPGTTTTSDIITNSTVNESLYIEPTPTIPEPEEEPSEKIKDIIEDLEEIVEDLEE